MQETDPETISWIRFLFASVTVVGLMAALAWGLKYFSMRGWIKTPKQGGKLQLLSSLPLDARRRLVLVKHEETEHLLLLGPAGDLLISSKPSSHVSSDPSA